MAFLLKEKEGKNLWECVFEKESITGWQLFRCFSDIDMPNDQDFKNSYPGESTIMKILETFFMLSSIGPFYDNFQEPLLINSYQMHLSFIFLFFWPLFRTENKNTLYCQMGPLGSNQTIKKNR